MADEDGETEGAGSEDCEYECDCVERKDGRPDSDGVVRENGGPDSDDVMGVLLSVTAMETLECIKLEEDGARPPSGC